MKLTQGAIGNLINRYRAVLKKCHLLNTFGSLAVASMLVMGGASVAQANVQIGDTIYQGNETISALQEAINEAQVGATIDITSDLNSGGIFVSASDKKDITIDYHGHTHTATNPAVGSEGTESQFYHLERGSSITLKNGTLKIADNAEGTFLMLLQNYQNLTLDNMIIDGNSLKLSDNAYTLSNNCGNITIKNSTIIAKENGVAFDLYYWPSNGYTEWVRATVTDSIIIGKIELTVDNSHDLAEGAIHQLTLTGGTLTGDLSGKQGAQLENWGHATISNVAMNGNTATDKVSIQSQL